MVADAVFSSLYRACNSSLSFFFCSFLVLYFFLFSFVFFSHSCLSCSFFFSMFFLFLFLSLFLPLFSPISFCFSSVFFALFPPFFISLSRSFFLSSHGIYKGEREQRELLPLSSHGAGVGWLGRSLRSCPRAVCGTFPLCLFHHGGRA